MITIILIVWLGAAAGYQLRRHPVRGIGQATTVLVWLLLFLMGEEAGSNPDVLRNMGRLGTEALALTGCTAATTVLMAAACWKHFGKGQGTGMAASHTGQTAVSLRTQMRDSLVIAGFFVFGCVAGYNDWCGFLPTQAGFCALCLLLACVGFGIGQNDEVRRQLRQMDKRLMLLPLATILATWVGAAFTAAFFPRYGMADWLAVSSGFGYYSLSSILITELRSPALGTLALLYNIFRELLVILCAPVLCRLFGPLAPICQGGATSGDTTLPIITSACGHRFVPLSIYHGICVDFTVPFLVPFFCGAGA